MAIAPKRQETGLENILSDDVTGQILKSLSPRDLAWAQATCTSWRRVADPFWTEHLATVKPLRYPVVPAAQGLGPLLDLGSPKEDYFDRRASALWHDRRYPGPTPRHKLHFLPGPSGRIDSMSLWNDTLVTSSGSEPVVRLWDLRRRCQVSQVATGGHAEGKSRRVLALGPDLFAVSSGSKVGLYKGSELKRTFGSPSASAYGPAETLGRVDGIAAGQTHLFVLRGAEIYVHDLYSGSLVQIWQPPKGLSNCMQGSPGCSTLLMNVAEVGEREVLMVFAKPGHISMYDTSSGAIILSSNLPYASPFGDTCQGTTVPKSHLAILALQKSLVCCDLRMLGGQETLPLLWQTDLWDHRSANPSASNRRGVCSPRVCVPPVGRDVIAVVGAGDTTLHLFDLKSGNRLKRINICVMAESPSFANSATPPHSANPATPPHSAASAISQDPADSATSSGIAGSGNAIGCSPAPGDSTSGEVRRVGLKPWRAMDVDNVAIMSYDNATLGVAGASVATTSRRRYGMVSVRSGTGHPRGLYCSGALDLSQARVWEQSYCADIAAWGSSFVLGMGPGTLQRPLLKPDEWLRRM